MDTKTKNPGLVERYKEKAINTLTRPFSKTVKLYEDPNWKNVPAKKPAGLLKRFAQKVEKNLIVGSQSLKGGH